VTPAWKQSIPTRLNIRVDFNRPLSEYFAAIPPAVSPRSNHARGSPQRPKEKFRRGADFLFGVLIAVALEKAVEGFLHVAAHGWLVDPVPCRESPSTSHPNWWLALLRLLIFAPMVASFYFGSLKYFEDTYSHPPSIRSDELGRRFRIDAFSGLIHFALFYTWSLCITAPVAASMQLCRWSVSPFLLMLVAVLVYDAVWYGFRVWATRAGPVRWKAHDQNTHDQIWKWTWKNLLVALWIVAAVLVLGGWFRPAIAEAIAIVPAIVVSVREFPKIVAS
jgi:hypothetical protein